MSEKCDTAAEDRPLSEEFLVILIQDVINAISKRETDDNQTNRRDLVRTAFVAIEGAAWEFKSGTVETARSLDLLSHDEEMALMEMVYSVSGHGRVTFQQRFIPLPASIRMTARLASKINPDFQVAFEGNGWREFREAIKVRNRITHPKRKNDLTLTSKEADACVTALNWLLNLHRLASEATLQSMREHSKLVGEVVHGLIDGDPELRALYDSLSGKLEI